MARTSKKEKMLTIEEKLEHALVPEAEQPYQVPENWCWVTIGSVLTLQAGKSISSSLITGEKDLDHPFPCFGGNGIRGYVSFFNREGLYPIIGRQGALCGNLNWAYGQFYATEHAVVVECPEFVNKKWAYYILKYMNLNQYATATAQPGLAVSNIIKLSLSLPPFAEQQRIVDRIESLFAKLDEAKEKAQAVVDGFEDRKAAILHKAFTGELTKDWRNKKGSSIADWSYRKLIDCGKWMGGGTPSMSKPEYWDNGDILWITSKDMKADLIDDTLMHTNMLGVTNSSANYCDRPSVIFVMRSGILRRTLPIATVKIPFTVNQDLKAVSPDDIDVDYLFWACECNEKNILNSCMKSGTTVESINASALMNFQIPIAPEEEQKVIVTTIVKMLQKEKTANHIAEKCIDQIDTMKKSILARVFRGELGTNDPADESAEELLKRIL